jgi:hypothetical protein
MFGRSQVAERQAAYQEGLSSVELLPTEEIDLQKLSSGSYIGHKEALLAFRTPEKREEKRKM